MIKILQIIGARPQIIKSAAISRAIKNNYSQSIEDIIVHTGQHYDENMSEVFMRELQIPKEKYNLKIGSASHGKQTALIIEKVEEILNIEKPNYIITYGDTNSTLAAAIAAVKIHIPIIHIEAGLRSFNKSMPEEINRIVCDHSSTILFSPTIAGIKNLIKEGFSENNIPPFTLDNPGIFHCGDIMYDNSLYFSEIAEKVILLERDFSVKKDSFILATIHRPSNTDSIENLTNICNSLIEISEKTQLKVVFPLHPRTKKFLQDYNLLENLESKITIIPPASFLQMIVLEKNCACVITDSGGVQKEAYYFEKPSVIVRDQTEWVEIVDAKCAVLSNTRDIVKNCIQILENQNRKFPKLFGDGKAAEFICEKLIENHKAYL